MRVYFAQAIAGGPIKVGISRDPFARVKTIRCPLTRRRPSVLAAINGDDVTERTLLHRFAARAIEVDSEAHRQLGPRPLWAPFEWFVPSPELMDVIAHVRTHGALPA